ncbi:hypothetical protein D048_3546B, partial [Vibrio parahaemolyticus VPTS-2009]
SSTLNAKFSVSEKNSNFNCTPSGTERRVKG